MVINRGSKINPIKLVINGRSKINLTESVVAGGSKINLTELVIIRRNNTNSGRDIIKLIKLIVNRKSDKLNLINN